MLDFTVTNMPGTIPWTASQTLSTIRIPCVQALAETERNSDRPLCRGINIEAASTRFPALEETFA